MESFPREEITQAINVLDQVTELLIQNKSKLTVIHNPGRVTPEMRRFLDERCTLAPEARTRATDLYESYVAWHRENVDSFPPSQARFGRRLRSLFLREKVGGVIQYRGIALKS